MTGARLIANSARTNLIGLPRETGTPAEIARKVILANAGKVLIAGQGHFRYFWIADFGKSIRGLMTVLPKPYLMGLVNRVLDAAVARGSVPTCLSEERAFDLPYPRADGLPWLVHAIDALDPTAFQHRRSEIESIVARFVADHFSPETGLMHPGVRGDWMDTIRRPSSTYNNLFALHLFRTLEKHGIAAGVATERAAALERDLVAQRWTGTHFTDYHGSSDYLSADANAPALYLGLFSPALRTKIVDAIEASDLLRPVPIRIAEQVHHAALMPAFTHFTREYHSSAWLHMGLLYVAGLRNERRSEADGHLERV
ncbi:MAG TPA: hypothetical protein VI565_08240, partial [Burkholderiales bacterium]|nr:hypothetical protein [Burkholderiales bacterium]